MSSSSSEHRHQAAAQSSSDTFDGEDSSSSMNHNPQYTGNTNRSRNESITELPALQENGERATERTEIPSSPVVQLKPLGGTSDEDASGGGGGGEGAEDATSNTTSEQSSSASTQVAKAEGKKTKIVTRVVSGAMMIATFLGLMYMGHLYICLLIALVECMLVR